MFEFDGEIWALRSSLFYWKTQHTANQFKANHTARQNIYALAYIPSFFCTVIEILGRSEDLCLSLRFCWTFPSRASDNQS
jgi:hypothetical protein